MTKPIDSNMNFLPSSIHNGQRMRAIAGKIYSCPVEWTFHHFLEDFAIDLIGAEWLIRQEKMDKANQNVLFQFAYSFFRDAVEAHKENQGKQKVFTVPCSGSNLAWMCLCYDLLCLEQKSILRRELIEKLKTNQYYQSTRHEIAISASLLRGGCDIQWVDTKQKAVNGKSCELIATHRRTKASFGVEVKSRRGKHILNEREDYGVLNLLKKALKQGPQDMPFAIFIDVSHPFEELADNNEKSLHRDIKKAVEAIEKSLPSPSPVNFIFGTNFPFHFDGSKPASPSEHIWAQASEPKHPLDSEVLNDIKDSLIRYGEIPREI